MRRPAVGRSQHLIDVENLYGEHHEALYEPEFGELYTAVVGRGPNDLITVGADRSHALDAALAFPGCRRVMGSGPNGADLALIDSIDWPSLQRGCDRLVIASGDGVFVEVAEIGRRHGLGIVVVSREKGLSRRLRAQADEVIEFPEFDPACLFAFTHAA